MEMWGYSADARFVKDATLSFDLTVLRERLAIESMPIDRHAAAALFRRSHLDPVRLLSDAVNDSDPSAQLYGDG